MAKKEKFTKEERAARFIDSGEGWRGVDELVIKKYNGNYPRPENVEPEQ